jgi:hypothetical protein
MIIFSTILPSRGTKERLLVVVKMTLGSMSLHVFCHRSCTSLLLLLTASTRMVHVVCECDKQISAPWSCVICFSYLMPTCACGQECGIIVVTANMCTQYTAIIPSSTLLLTQNDLNKSAKYTSDISFDGISKHPWPSWVSW